MKVAIAADHGGFELKEQVKKHFPGVDWVDYGTNSPDSVDYPDIIAPLARDISNKKIEKGIIICGSGIGASIVANRFKGVRAALCHNEFTAEMCRRHNDANILALGGRVVSPDLAEKMIDLFFKIPFEGGRHAGRLQKIHSL